MTDIKENIIRLRQELPKGVALVAVSKFHPIESVRAAKDAGQTIFGESRAQELVVKHSEEPDLQWHFIGHLQTNKIRQVVPCVSLIHSVDSENLLESIDKEAARAGLTVDVLLQLHVALEESKFGFTCDDCLRLADSGALSMLKNVNVRGVMGMATNTDDSKEIAKEFRQIRTVFDRLKMHDFLASDSFSIVSMGMSHDYKIAIDEGSNMVRIGTSIFGEREY